MVNAGEGEPPVTVLLFDGSDADLTEGEGRVLVGHGADDSLLEPVDVINVDACPPAVLDDFAFAEVAGPLDLSATTLNLAFSLTSTGECSADAGPLAAPVTPDLVTLLIAVDTDTLDQSLAPAIYALIGDASGTIPTLDPSP